jgi:hypothetical protein
MDSSKLSEMRSDYKDLKAVFFDQVSLMGKTMLAFVDQRLRQFTGKNQFMGGLHVIFVGDLIQLKPVKDGYVFEDLKSGFNALGGNLWPLTMWKCMNSMSRCVRGMLGCLPTA